MQIKWIGSPNFGYPRGTHGQNDPEALFWHITASRPTIPPLDGLDGWFQDLSAGSTQLGIQDKECHQYVRFEDACWGQGYMSNPDLSNPNVYRWYNNDINPNLKSIGVEVVSMPGPMEVPRGVHAVNNDTWSTMKEVGLYIAEEFPKIKLVTVNWLGHWQVDGINRQRDPKNAYWPTDILEEVIEENMKRTDDFDDMEEDMKIVSVQGQGTTWRTNGFVKLFNTSPEEREYWADLYGIPRQAEVISKDHLDRLRDVSPEHN